MSEPSTGFVPPDLTHPQEWAEAWAWVASSSFWWLLAFLGMALCLGLLRWLVSRIPSGSQAEAPLDEALANTAKVLKMLPQVALAAALLTTAFGLCTSLAARSHHKEQAARSALVDNLPEGRIEQMAPTFGHIDHSFREESKLEQGKRVVVKLPVAIERTHHLSGTELQVELLSRPDAAHPEQEAFAVQFKGNYKLTSPLNEAGEFFIDLPSPSGCTVVANLKVLQEGRVLSPQSPGSSRYLLQLGPGALSEVQYSYEAQGLPRWVYNTQGARLSAFKLHLRTNSPTARFASGVAPKQDAWLQGQRDLLWDFPVNATLQEPVGVFTAVGDLKPGGFAPRWFLLAPGLMAVWFAALAFLAELKAKAWALAGGFFLAAVVATYALHTLLPLPMAWGLASLGVAALAGHLAVSGNSLRVGTLLCLVLPGLGLALGHAALGLALSGALAVAWLSLSLQAAGPAKAA